MSFGHYADDRDNAPPEDLGYDAWACDPIDELIDELAGDPAADLCPFDLLEYCPTAEDQRWLAEDNARREREGRPSCN